MISSVGQLDFIKIANETKNTIATTQNEDGSTTLDLRPDVSIIHRYQAGGKMVIIFKEDQSRYVIPERRILLYLINMHESNENFVQWARQWCKEHLKAV